MVPFQIGLADLHKNEHQRCKGHNYQKRQISPVFLRVERQPKWNHNPTNQNDADNFSLIFQLSSPFNILDLSYPKNALAQRRPLFFRADSFYDFQKILRCFCWNLNCREAMFFAVVIPCQVQRSIPDKKFASSWGNEFFIRAFPIKVDIRERIHLQGIKFYQL